MMSKNSLLKPLWLLSALLFVVLPASFTSCRTAQTGTALVQQSSYPELPVLQPGAVYSPRMETVRRIAQEDEASGAIAPGRYQAVTALLTDRNVLYQTNPDGQRVACIPMLAAMLDNDVRRGGGSARMQQIFDAAYADGMKITADIFGIAQANGLYMDGLENAVKAASHIADKARRWLSWWREEYHQPEATVEDVAASFNDLVRYSAITDKAHYVEATLQLIASLREHGYEVETVDNRFLDKEGRQDMTRTYRAVHLTIRSGERLVEIQVHDHSSQAIREYTHGIYERMRQLDENTDEYRRYAQQCIDAWRDYVNPEGIERIKQ